MEQLLLSYAEDLNDAYPGHEFSIWKREQLLTYFNEALCVIAANRPDMFSELKVAKVDTCTMYLDTCDCNKVIDVLGQSDSKGRNIRPLNMQDERMPAWRGRRVARGFANELTGYEIMSGGKFVRVFPDTIDPNKDYYVTIRCFAEPKKYTLDDEEPDTRCAFVAAARHWVLYCAKMVDGEFSQAMQAQAQEHRLMFDTILKMVDNGDPRELSADEYKRMSLAQKTRGNTE